MSSNNQSKTILIEFYGIPRQRVGVAAIDLPVLGESATLAEVLSEVGRRFRNFSDSCLENGRLQKQYVANLDGQRFVSEPAEVIRGGSSLLIMSADAGG